MDGIFTETSMLSAVPSGSRVHVKGYFYFRIDDALYLLRVCHIYVQGIFRSLRSVIDMEVIHNPHSRPRDWVA